jgi:hypothetical protein
MKKLKINRRKLKYGGFSALITIIFLVGAILLNVVVTLLSDRFNVQADLTENKLYTLSEDTTAFLDGLTSDVTIYFAAKQTDIESWGIEYGQASRIAQQFAAQSGHVNIEYIDYLQNPTFANKYSTDLSNLTDTDVVVESAATGRFKVLNAADYIDVHYYFQGEELTYEYASMYAQMGAAIETSAYGTAEQAFLGAILTTTNEDVVNVAFLSGFGEGIINNAQNLLYSDFATQLEENGYTVETIDINLAPTVEEKFDFTVIYTPTSDYSNEALTKLDTWLDNGGSYGKTLIFVADMAADVPNLNAFLAEWGMKVEDTYVIQTNSEYAYGQGTDYSQIFAIPEGNPFAEGISNAQILSYMYPSRVVSVVPAATTVTNTPLLTGFEGAQQVISDSDGNALLAGGASGTDLNVAAMGTKSAYNSLNALQESRVIVFGASNLFDSDIGLMRAEQYANARFAMNIFNSISGREDAVYVEPKTFTMSTFQITSGQANLIMWIFCIILPLALIVTGIVVYVRRRYK